MGKLIAANWKEHPKTEVEALKLFKAAVAAPRPRGVEGVSCPPFIYLEEIAREFRHMPAHARKQFAVGAQDVFWEEQGAFTSEVGPRMLLLARRDVRDHRPFGAAPVCQGDGCDDQ